MDYKTIIYEKKDRVAIIRLNRPDRKNAMSRQMSAEIKRAFEEAEQEPEVGAVVLTGGPDCFCAGADLKEVDASASGDEPIEPGMGEKIRYLAKPTIAAIGGYCIAGGIEIALDCDIRIASEEALIADRHTKMGLLGIGVGLAALPRLIGPGLAKELIFTGDFIDIKEAYRIGLVNHVYPKDEFIDEAIALAQKIASNPPETLRMAKKAIEIGLQMSRSEAMRHAEICNDELKASAEYKDRVAKFVKK